MKAASISCNVIMELMGRWRDGDMDQFDRDAYEQHLLFCPPCLDQNNKARIALASLREAAVAAPPEELLRDITELVERP